MNTTQKIHLKTKDYLVSGEEFRLIESEFTDILKTTPVPNANKLPEYYKSEHYISHTDTKRNFTEKVYHFIKGIALKQKVSLITKMNKRPGKLLDVGSGTGDFLATAQQKNWTVFGVEPNKIAATLSEKKGIRVSSDINEISESDFDVITLWHVLEHVPNVEAYIIEISNILKTSGTLIIAVPNYKSRDAQHYKQFWAAYDAPRHLWHFSKKGIQHLFDKHDFKLVKTHPMWFDAFYVSLLSEKYKTGRSNWLNALYRGLQSNFSGITSKEYSSHIYILKKKQ